jgi:hypothetical protein
MRRIYARIREAQDTTDAVAQLLREGVDSERIQLYSANPGELEALPVRVSRLRWPRKTMWRGGIAGGLVGLGLTIVIAVFTGPIGPVPGIAIVLLCALVGALVWRLALDGGADREALEVARRQGGLKRGETVLLLDVPDAQAQEIERRLKQAHPQIAVLGTDPSGTPPFP